MNRIRHKSTGLLRKTVRVDPALTALVGWFTLLLMVPAAGGQSAAELPTHLHEPFSRCVEAQKSGRLDEAERCLTGVLSRGGNASFVRHNLGVIYQMQRQHEKAITQFREAIRLQPGYLAPRILLGASLISLGRLAEATQQLEKAVRLQPGNMQAREQLVRAYAQTGNLVGLVEQYRTMRKLKPEDPELAYQLGKAYVKLSGWCHREIASQDPNSPRVFQSLAQSHSVQGRTAMAVRYYRRAIEADPELPENHLALAMIYLQQGKLPDARREVDSELAIVPHSAAAIELKKKIESSMLTAPQP